MSTTIGESISRIRNVVKGVKEDAFLTDRFIYSLVLKYSKLLIRRQDNEGKIIRYNSLFDTIPCVDLIEVDKVEACCTGIKTKCTIMRTKEKLPALFEGSLGPIFRSVTSLDRSQVLVQTDPKTYTSIANSTSHKYNKTKYFWYQDGHLYFPNVMWEGVLVEALWDEDIDFMKCNIEQDVKCNKRQDDKLRIPDYLFGEIEQLALKELVMMFQVPMDSHDDKQSIHR